MKENIPLVISIIINIVFIVLSLIYFFTPIFDYTIISNSLPRMCNYAEKNQPSIYQDIKICHLNK